MKLCLLAGRLDADIALRQISAKQLRQWEMLYEIEPFEYREDVRAAQITAMIFNMAVAVKDRKPISHFLLSHAEDEADAPPPQQRKQTVEEQLNIAYHIVAMYNAGAWDPTKVQEIT